MLVVLCFSTFTIHIFFVFGSELSSAPVTLWLCVHILCEGILWYRIRLHVQSTHFALWARLKQPRPHIIFYHNTALHVAYRCSFALSTCDVLWLERVYRFRCNRNLVLKCVSIECALRAFCTLVQSHKNVICQIERNKKRLYRAHPLYAYLCACAIAKISILKSWEWTQTKNWNTFQLLPMLLFHAAFFLLLLYNLQL